MAKVNVDWNNLGFAYQPISQRYVANFKDGKWGEGHLTDDANVTINECAGILQYCQEVFEGLKAYKTKDGRVVTFRPDMNAKRMIDSAKRLEMPPVSEEMFLEAVDQVVAANKDWIPTCARTSSPRARSSVSSRLTNISSVSSARRLAPTSRTA